jgi:hypothetical protein
MNPSVTLIVALCLTANPAGAKQPDKDAATAQIILDGRYIETVTLQRKDGERRQIVRGPSLSLPPGWYDILEITIKGGYSYHIRYKDKSPGFTLTADKPYHLCAGAPLRPHVEVTRQGQWLAMDYQLLDAAGRKYRGEDRSHPPRWTIMQGDRQIDAGTFEYG